MSVCVSVDLCLSVLSGLCNSISVFVCMLDCVPVDLCLSVCWSVYQLICVFLY